MNYYNLILYVQYYYTDVRCIQYMVWTTVSTDARNVKKKEWKDEGMNLLSWQLNYKI